MKLKFIIIPAILFSSMANAGICDFSIFKIFCNEKRTQAHTLNCDALKDKQLVLCLSQQRALDYSIKNDPYLQKQFSKDKNLQDVLNSDTSYQEAISKLSLDHLFAADSGVREGYSVGVHSILALIIVQSQEPFYDVDNMGLPAYVQEPKRFMKYLTAYHDIGKSIGYRVYGDNSHEIEYSYPLVWRLMISSNFSEYEAKLAISLVHEHKVIGDYLVGKLALDDAALTLKKYSRFSKTPVHSFYAILEYLYVADAGSYPYLRESVFSEATSGKLTIRDQDKIQLLKQALGIH